MSTYKNEKRHKGIFRSFEGHPERRTCLLMITHACNLNCVYCYEKFKSDKQMSVETAKKLILQELDLVRDSELFKELEIDFMGGEPMMNFELIKEVVEWAEEQRFDTPLIFFFNTNGTLVTAEEQKWLYAHRDSIVAGLSYDGTRDMQNLNRDTSLAPIDVEFFARTWPFQPFKMTVSRETLPHLAEGIIDLALKGYLIDPSLAQGVEWQEEDAAILTDQLKQLKEFYLEHTDIVPDAMMGLPFKGMGNKSVQLKKFCGSGNYMVTYDVDEKQYPCHMFTPLVMGGKAVTTEQSELAKNSCYSDPNCEKCDYRHWCSTCYGFNYKDRGDITKRDYSWCKIVPALAKGVCEFQLEYYYKFISELSADDLEHLNSLIACYDVISAQTE